MTQKHVFVESPLKLALFAMPIVSSVLTILTVVFAPAIPIIVYVGIFFVTFALGVLICSFYKKKTITCDSVGCQVEAKHLWERSGETYHFKWSEVTLTKVSFTEVHGGDGGYLNRTHFEVIADGQERELKQWDRFSSKSFDRFVALVNEATPHLPYIWVKDKGNVEGIEKVGEFIKVPRS
jgi:hypothetical protein